MSDKPINLWKAILAVQSEVNVVHKDAVNPHYRSRYATLGAVLEAVRPVALKHGLVIMQSPGLVENGCIKLHTSIIHAATGESVDSNMSLPLAKGDPQGAGSAISYGCRYSLMSLFALSALEDDDAESQSHSDSPPRPSPRSAGDSRGSGTRASAPPVPKLDDAKSFTLYSDLIADIARIQTKDEMKEWADLHRNDVLTLQDSDFNTFKDKYAEKLRSFPKDG